MLRSRKKLWVFDALPSYIGGKRRLAPLIFGEINKVIPRRCWSRLRFLDAFMGGGSIALFAKMQGFGKVIGTDLALRSVTVGQALIANDRVRLTKQDVIRVLAPYDGPPGRVELEMVPTVFTKSQARAIDNSLRIASLTEDVAKAALLRLLAMRLALLAHPFSQIRRGTIHRLETKEYEDITPSAVYHYIDGLRLATVEKLWSLAEQINGGIVAGTGEVFQTDIVKTLPAIEADVMYADPPYANVCSYEKEYRILDEILEGRTRPTSPFTRRDGASQIDQFLERAVHIPVWALSFGNAACTLEELEGKMTRLGRKTRAIALKYLHLPAVATEQKKKDNREFLLIGVDPASALVRETEVGMQLVGIDRPLSRAIVHHDSGTDATERPAPQTLGHDPLQQGKADPPQEFAPFLGGESVAKTDAGLDEPDTVIGKPGSRTDREGGLGGHDTRGSLGTACPVKETTR